METITRDMPTAHVPTMRLVLAEVGWKVVSAVTTPGAVGYTTVTYKRVTR